MAADGETGIAGHPVDGTFDLHTFRSGDVKALIEDRSTNAGRAE